MPAGAIEASQNSPLVVRVGGFQCQLVRLRRASTGAASNGSTPFQCQLVRLRPGRPPARHLRVRIFQCQLVRLRPDEGASVTRSPSSFNASWCD